MVSVWSLNSWRAVGLGGESLPTSTRRQAPAGPPPAERLRYARSRDLLVLVVVVPPLVWRGLRVALRRVLPLLLAAQRGDVEVGPGAAHPLVAPGVDEVGSEHLVAVADEGVGAVPVAHPEVGVEVVRNRIPGDVLPAHTLLQALDLLLRGARGKGERGVAAAQVCGVGHLICDEGATDACPLRVRAPLLV